MEPKDFLSILMSLAGGLMSVVGLLVWRIVQRIEEKVEEVHTMTCTCRESLPVRFASKKEMEQCQREMDRLWEVVNRHEHDELGRVIRI